MRKVFKFAIKESISIQVGAKFLHFDFQDHKPFAWFEVNPQNPSKERFFQIFGTGQSIPDGYFYLGTHLQGPFVWHLYEVPKLIDEEPITLYLERAASYDSNGQVSEWRTEEVFSLPANSAWNFPNRGLRIRRGK